MAGLDLDTLSDTEKKALIRVQMVALQGLVKLLREKTKPDWFLRDDVETIVKEFDRKVAPLRAKMRAEKTQAMVAEVRKMAWDDWEAASPPAEGDGSPSALPRRAVQQRLDSTSPPPSS